MNVMDPSVTGLRVLREVAERGSFTAAAASLGYTQSAVSRQAAALERVAGTRLFDRRPGGVALTHAGRTLLRHAQVALDALDVADRELRGLATESGIIRLGTFPSAGALLVPHALTALRRRHPGIRVTTREGSTPALVRGLRAGTVDLALLATRAPGRPLDDQSPPLEALTLLDTELLLAVPDTSELGADGSVGVAQLADQDWVVSPTGPAEPMMGAWPGLPARARIAHTSRDWLTKLHLVAAGCGITVVPQAIAEAIPAGVRLVQVRDAPAERRQVVVAWLPGAQPTGAAALVQALRQEARRHPG